MNEKDILHEYFSRLGKKSVKGRLKKLTPEERSRIASKAVNARWARTKAKAESERKKSK